MEWRASLEAGYAAAHQDPRWKRKDRFSADAEAWNNHPSCGAASPY